ncbi:MAG: right-handed parallel beta-helix repeat-containing protein [Nanoarchaeota archaeon]|nr:right-handed parallel beta-helix repeat-containing protein [Nanoarchaeota archaeon]
MTISSGLTCDESGLYIKYNVSPKNPPAGTVAELYGVACNGSSPLSNKDTWFFFNEDPVNPMVLKSWNFDSATRSDPNTAIDGWVVEDPWSSGSTFDDYFTLGHLSKYSLWSYVDYASHVGRIYRDVNYLADAVGMYLKYSEGSYGNGRVYVNITLSNGKSLNYVVYSDVGMPSNDSTNYFFDYINNSYNMVWRHVVLPLYETEMSLFGAQYNITRISVELRTMNGPGEHGEGVRLDDVYIYKYNKTSTNSKGEFYTSTTMFNYTRDVTSEVRVEYDSSAYLSKEIIVSIVQAFNVGVELSDNNVNKGASVEVYGSTHYLNGGNLSAGIPVIVFVDGKVDSNYWNIVDSFDFEDSSELWDYFGVTAGCDTTVTQEGTGNHYMSVETEPNPGFQSAFGLVFYLPAKPGYIDKIEFDLRQSQAEGGTDDVLLLQIDDRGIEKTIGLAHFVQDSSLFHNTSETTFYLLNDLPYNTWKRFVDHPYDYSSGILGKKIFRILFKQKTVTSDSMVMDIDNVTFYEGYSTTINSSSAYSFTLDPTRITPGGHWVTVGVTDEYGVTSENKTYLQVLPVLINITSPTPNCVGDGMNLTVISNSYMKEWGYRIDDGDWIILTPGDVGVNQTGFSVPIDYTMGNHTIVVNGTTLSGAYNETNVSFSTCVDLDGDGFGVQCTSVCRYSEMDCNDNSSIVRPLFNNTINYIDENTIVCRGEYATRVVVNGSNVSLNCNSSLLYPYGESQTGILVSADYVNVSNCNIVGFYDSWGGGIMLGRPYANLVNNNISYCSSGIFIESGEYHSDFNNIINNTLSNNDYGLVIINSEGNNILDSTIANSKYMQFYSKGGQDNTVTNLTLVDDVSNATVSFTGRNIGIGTTDLTNVPEPPTNYIIRLVNVTNTSTNSWISLNISYTDLDASSVNESNLYIWKWDNDNGWRGILTSGVNTVENYVYSGNVTSFSLFIPAEDNYCSCDSCDSCSKALDSSDCSVVKLTQDIINQSGNCIYAANFINKTFDCQGYKIDGDNSGYSGIYLDKYNYNNSIKNCVVSDFGFGIYVESENNILTNNSLAGDAEILHLFARGNNTIDESNTVNGWPVYYRYGVSNAVLENQRYGHVYFGNGNNITIRNVTISDGDWIFLDNANNSKIINSNLNESLQGIVFDGVNVIIDNNNLYGDGAIWNWGDIQGDSIRISNNYLNNTWGVYLGEASNVGVSSNKVYNSVDTDAGIYLENINTSNVNGNVIVDSEGDGLVLDYSSNVNVTSNTIKNSQYNGVTLYSSSNVNLVNNSVSNSSIWDVYSEEGGINNIVRNLDTNGTTSSFTFKDVALKAANNPGGIPANYSDIGKFLNITNNSANAWIYINISYNDSDWQNAGVNEQAFSIWKYNGSWYNLSNSGVDPSANYVFSGNVTSFSVFAPLGIACIDNDGDGFNSTGGSCGPIDCDDNNATIRPLYNNTHNIIDRDIVICKGKYNSSIEVVASNVTVDCNGSTLYGNYYGVGVYLNNVSDVLKNCVVENQSYGVTFSQRWLTLPKDSNRATLYNISLSNQDVSIVSGYAYNATLKNITVTNSSYAIYFMTAINTTITNLNSSAPVFMSSYSCVGKPDPCSTHRDALVCVNAGCTWNWLDMRCEGVPYTCEVHVGESVCETSGCDWNITNANTIIENSAFYNAASPIQLREGRNFTVEGNEFHGCSYAVNLSSVSDTVIKDNEFTNCGSPAVWVTSNSQDVGILSNKLSSSGYIKVNGSSNVFVKDNYLHYSGVEVIDSDHLILRNNSFIRDTQLRSDPALVLSSVSDSVVENNTLRNYDSAAQFSNLNNVTVSGNKITRCGFPLSVDSSNDVNIIGNILMNNTYDTGMADPFLGPIFHSSGINVRLSDSINISSNIVSGSSYGIEVESVNNSMLVNNTVYDTMPGVTLFEGLGIVVEDTNNISLSNNIVTNNNYGVYIVYSNNTTLNNDRLYNNAVWQLYSEANSTGIANLLNLGSFALSFDFKDIALNSATNPGEIPANYVDIGKFLNITNTSANSWIYLNVPYTDADVYPVEESTLRMWEYNSVVPLRDDWTDSLDHWEASISDAEFILNDTDKIIGNYSISLDVPLTTSFVIDYYNDTKDWNLNAEDADRFIMWVKSNASNVYKLTSLTFYDVNGAKAIIEAKELYYPTNWTKWTFMKSDFFVEKGFDWGDVEYMELTIEKNSGLMIPMPPPHYLLQWDGMDFYDGDPQVNVTSWNLVKQALLGDNWTESIEHWGTDLSDANVTLNDTDKVIGNYSIVIHYFSEGRIPDVSYYNDTKDWNLNAEDADRFVVFTKVPPLFEGFLKLYKVRLYDGSGHILEYEPADLYYQVNWTKWTFMKSSFTPADDSLKGTFDWSNVEYITFENRLCDFCDVEGADISFYYDGMGFYNGDPQLEIINGVNESGNYVFANITSFSIFAPLGLPKKTCADVEDGTSCIYDGDSSHDYGYVDPTGSDICVNSECHPPCDPAEPNNPDLGCLAATGGNWSYCCHKPHEYNVCVADSHECKRYCGSLGQECCEGGSCPYAGTCACKVENGTLTNECVNVLGTMFGQEYFRMWNTTNPFAQGTFGEYIYSYDMSCCSGTFENVTAY